MSFTRRQILAYAAVVDAARELADAVGFEQTWAAHDRLMHALELVEAADLDAMTGVAP